MLLAHLLRMWLKYLEIPLHGFAQNQYEFVRWYPNKYFGTKAQLIADGYQDITEMFRSDIIKSSSYYKYDYSLSVSRLYNQFTTWGEILPRS